MNVYIPKSPPLTEATEVLPADALGRFVVLADYVRPNVLVERVSLAGDTVLLKLTDALGCMFTRAFPADVPLSLTTTVRAK